MRILISAYACCPGRGSEPGVGWNWALQAARFHEVWVLTREKNREAIEAVRPSNMHPVYVDLPKWARFWKKGYWAIWPYYHLWQRKAGRVAQRLHRDVGFHLAHHVTFGSILSTTHLGKIPIPILVGPIGGGEYVPRDLRSSALLKFAVMLMRAREGGLGRNLRRVSSVIASNPSTARYLQRVTSGSVRLMSQMGVSSRKYESGSDRSVCDDRVHLLYVGRLMFRKGIDLAVDAAGAMQTQEQVSFKIVGDGPLRHDMQRRAERLSNGSRIEFAGAVSATEVKKELLSADIFVYPSVKDNAPSAILEAMAAGLPIICLDLGGPGMLVTDECGIKIPPSSRESIVRDMAAAIDKLAASPDLRRRMGEAGRRRVIECFNWDRKGEEMDMIYHEVAAKRN